MKLRSIRVFCDVVTRRSFSQAADDNKITQSATSQIIQQLEERLGVQLLDRSKRPFNVTEEGQLYYEGCRHLIRQVEDLESSIRNLSSARGETIHVVSIYSVGLSYMRQFVQRFNESNPDIHVQLEYQHPQKVYDLVKTGEAHLGLLSYATATQSIAAIDWRAEPMVVVLASGHPLADCDEIPLQSLHAQDMVAFSRDLRISQEIHAVLADSKITPKIVMEFDNIETLKRAIEINTGFSILPKAHVQRERAAGSLCTVEIMGPPLVRPVGIIHRKKAELSTNIENFITMLIRDEHVFPEGEQHPERTADKSTYQYSVLEKSTSALDTGQLFADRTE